MPQIERDVVQSVQSIKTSDPDQAIQQMRQHLTERGYQFGQNAEGKTSRVIDPKTEIQVHLASGQFEGKSLRELFNQRLEQVRQEELKPKLRQNRGLGL